MSLFDDKMPMTDSPISCEGPFDTLICIRYMEKEHNLHEFKIWMNQHLRVEI